MGRGRDRGNGRQVDRRLARMGTSMSALSQIAEAMREDVKKRRVEFENEGVVKEAWMEWKEKVVASALEEGFERLKEIRATLDLLEEDGDSRSANQRFLHSIFDAVCARIIWGAGFNEKKIMDREGWHKANMVQSINIITPRRWGKTTLCAMYAFALLVNVPGIKIAVFAPSEGQSVAILKAILNLIARKTPNQRLSTCNNTEIALDFGRGDRRSVHAYSSNAKVRPLVLSPRLSLRLSSNSEFSRLDSTPHITTTHHPPPPSRPNYERRARTSISKDRPGAAEVRAWPTMLF